MKYLITTNQYIFKYLFELPPKKRKFVLFSLDFLVVWISLFLSKWIFSDDLNSAFFFNKTFEYLLFTIVCLSVYRFTGQYKALLQYLTIISVYTIVIRNLLITIFLFLFNFFFDFGISFLKEFILFWLFSTCLSTIIRFTFREILLRLINSNKLKNIKVNNKIAIYGAGVGGAQLAASLRITGDYEIISFIDDNSDLWNRSLDSIPINSPKKLKNMISNIDQIFIAIPSLERNKRKTLINLLGKFKIPIFEIPSLKELTSGTARINDLRPIDVEDLLGRDTVPPLKELLEPAISGYRILVTGAGGSIGSELCRQIINLNPESLIMIESSEPSLYAINQEVNKNKKNSLKVHSILGNTRDEIQINKIFSEFNIDIVFHAAAYKHVPLVEQNPVHSLLNNVFSTKVICDAAKKNNIDKVILISSDKAVRPTNIMGASKRLSELIVQAFAFEQEKFFDSKNRTIYTSVRFGNVLGSSGSVVPLFRKQIKNGGPITLTHKNMVRYFMTIPESVQLVIQASVLAEGGDIFLLDMGNPVKIYDLALNMINLSGLRLKDKLNPDGDIEILCTGIREGEKLYEELLIDGLSKPTKHPLIYKAIENKLEPTYLWLKLDQLKSFLINYEKNNALDILGELVKEWKMNLSDKKK